MLDTPIARRVLLLAGGALVVSFSFVPRAADAQPGGGKTVSADEVGGFIAVDAKGALLVADDVGNTVWRITPAPVR